MCVINLCAFPYHPLQNKNVKGRSSASARIFSMSTFLEILASRLLDISTQLSNSLVKYILFLPGVVLGAALVA